MQLHRAPFSYLKRKGLLGVARGLRHGAAGRANVLAGAFDRPDRAIGREAKITQIGELAGRGAMPRLMSLSAGLPARSQPITAARPSFSGTGGFSRSAWRDRSTEPTECRISPSRGA